MNVVIGVVFENLVETNVSDAVLKGLFDPDKKEAV